MKRLRYQELSRADLELELATARFEHECAQLAALVGDEPVTKWIAFTKMRIEKLTKLLAAV